MDANMRAQGSTCPTIIVLPESRIVVWDIGEHGAMFASMIFVREPLFYGNSNLRPLVRVSKVLGHGSLFEYLDKYKINGFSR